MTQTNMTQQLKIIAFVICGIFMHHGLHARVTTGSTNSGNMNVADTQEPAKPSVTETDICVYGGTASGVVAAVQASRMGKSVVIIEPGKHIGGMTSSGLGNTDVGRPETIGGIAREFYQLVHQWYQDPAHWKYQTKEEFIASTQPKRIAPDALFVFEPHVAELKLNEMIANESVSVVFGERLDLKNGVKKENNQIVSIRMESGRTFVAKVFIDCSYEGDLLAKAGVSYTVGREGNARYDEKINGVQTKEPARIGDRPLDPFIIPGDSTSGVIEGLVPDVVGAEGDGDKMVQAYNYRLCLTGEPENRFPFNKPEGYDESEFELLFRWLEAGNTRGLPLGSNPVPNKKTDTNKGGWVSTDYMGHADDYPDADYEAREKILNDHLRYTKGFLWTLANHPRVPEVVRARASKLGLAKDEFVDNGHFPFQLYVREGRRMIGNLVMTEHHLRSNPKVTDPVALGSYGMDSHPTQIWVDKDGALHADTPKWTGVPPYGISYQSITPKEEECSNLLVTCCVSASHSAYGSIRMEPVYMMLGQSAATAAALAIDKEVSIHQLNYDELKVRLLADKQILEYSKD
ncbi:FAD-dependent oxidoreductase [Mangrovibacterium sp.]|uniref:FAD-dependent oxidoreductase n=1 Tax=Mangrovibacterium sp. TaxID=1961364 RepID=UPI003566AD08